MHTLHTTVDKNEAEKQPASRFLSPLHSFVVFVVVNGRGLSMVLLCHVQFFLFPQLTGASMQSRHSIRLLFCWVKNDEEEAPQITDLT
ncbi:hypothetical protein BJX68DRAFT_58717 [Aspergillus pseudodeflectus]|uniref:Transmembrane protein n=1 Tax=Aspergillus pseudodeflectus TaxID=176178 RepID=A0ABR4KKH1_9EURO